MDKENGNYRTISLSQMSKGKLACTLPWREIEGKANISLSQTSKDKLACTLPWREIEGKANERERGVQGYALVFKHLQK